VAARSGKRQLRAEPHLMDKPSLQTLQLSGSAFGPSMHTARVFHRPPNGCQVRFLEFVEEIYVHGYLDRRGKARH
jgi:hypothetical protein